MHRNPRIVYCLARLACNKIVTKAMFKTFFGVVFFLIVSLLNFAFVNTDFILANWTTMHDIHTLVATKGI